MSSSSSAIKFLPFSSTVDSPFWVQYNHLKLETIRLKEDPIDICGTYTAGEGRLQCIETSLLDTSSSSTNPPPSIPNDRVAFPGILIGLNTLESFSKLDKNKLLSKYYDSKQLLKFVLLTFCDLKNHKVLYWFGIPALMNQSPIQATLLSTDDDDEASQQILNQVPQRFHQLRKNRLENNNNNNNNKGLPAFFVMDKTNENVIELLNEQVLDKIPIENAIFGFVDSAPSATTATSTSASNTAIPPMGWPLRTMLAYLSIHLKLGGQTITIVSYRPSRLRRIVSKNDDTALPDNDASLLFQVTVPNDYIYNSNVATNNDDDDDDDDDNINKNSQYKVVGWELNARQKPGPRWVNLRPLLDSNHLAIQAADLNLKLMKWRMLPELNVSKLQETKCLLIGAGTLGCSVARTLLGWGIRHFTILDYGNVSYSNPVRQNLFTLEDCHVNNGAGKPKAQAAVDALKQIAADVHAEAIRLSIPMPGHAAETKESVTEAVMTLDKLIQEADVVYLLTDTRESRWLPTIMAAAHDKLLINAALGLDSWLVMRHGGGVVVPVGKGDDTTTTTTTTTTAADRLGCYFCNDIVAPENSTKNRTLDQQCTVTRPGLAPIASSMAVELMVSTLHHPKRQRAPAAKSMGTFSPTIVVNNNNKDNNDENSASSPLGVMPHQIRGSLVSYTMMTPTVPAFVCCTACSVPTIEAYQKDKIDLVYQACQCKDGSYLETVSGLTTFRAEAAEKMADMEDWDDDDLDE